jgi:hypothetical protein
MNLEINSVCEDAKSTCDFCKVHLFEGIIHFACPALLKSFYSLPWTPELVQRRFLKLACAVIRVLTITQERRDVAESARDKLYADLWGCLRFSLNERGYEHFSCSWWRQETRAFSSSSAGNRNTFQHILPRCAKLWNHVCKFLISARNLWIPIST